MKSIIGFVLAAVLLVAPTAMAQHGHGGSRSGSHGGGSRGSGGEQHSRGGEQHSRGGDGHFNRDRHGRIDQDRGVRDRGGRREVFFDGFWFGCDVWPEWVFGSDVYVLVVDDGYIMYSYDDPSVFVSINIVQ